MANISAIKLPDGVTYNIKDSYAKDFIVDSGTTDGWTWKKYDSGLYEAEKYVDYGNVTASTALATIEGNVKLYVTASIPSTAPTPPHTLTSGYVVYDYIGNTTGYSLVLRSTDNKIQLGRLASSSVTLNSVKLVYRVVNGKWK